MARITIKSVPPAIKRALAVIEESSSDNPPQMNIKDTDSNENLAFMAIPDSDFEENNANIQCIFFTSKVVA